MKNLLIIVPVQNRPHRIEPLLKSIRETCEARVIFAATGGYDAELATLERLGCEYSVFEPNPLGDYAHKINTIAFDEEEPLIFLGADDIIFHEGWYEAAAGLTGWRQQGMGYGVVGTNDMMNEAVISGQHSTHSLVTREYANMGLADGEPGILCEHYAHEFCDSEQIETAKFRGEFVSARNSFVEHRSWHNPQYRHRVTEYNTRAAQMRHMYGERTYDERKHLWGK